MLSGHLLVMEGQSKGKNLIGAAIDALVGACVAVQRVTHLWHRVEYWLHSVP